ncbi:MAG: pantetheine-phosphate adenylyltransferase [Bacteroidaceae bacterium]|nr:pantetheine-phosphate adenylyltransferase [Bacteroidaceae bacterium]
MDKPSSSQLHTTPLPIREGQGGGSSGGGSTLLFPGSFDPFTRGHANLVERALALFGEVVIAVGINPQKPGWIPAEERLRALREYYKSDARVRVESYTGLTVDFAASIGARAILRGLRSVKDYEYELSMADVNRQLAAIETVILFADPELAAISSSVVRELAHFGKDITPFLPEGFPKII